MVLNGGGGGGGNEQARELNLLEDWGREWLVRGDLWDHPRALFSYSFSLSLFLSRSLCGGERTSLTCWEIFIDQAGNPQDELTIFKSSNKDTLHEISHNNNNTNYTSHNNTMSNNF